ncbi:LysM peptidoglycan-binding domain-containing protein [Nonomuraea ceibae]|uniref:LysM peptidoglycan-binding domain-containing protein n=1 Tax=Nonomuraea ceibae TaxID=1935170 RepID=UPI001C5CC96A|nr:LysM peptidoglycan-binding domain-containing protein [Nonomuraea ceibae]
MRLTRRGRAVLVMGVALLSLAGFWLGTRAASMAEAEPATPAQVGAPWIEVQRGDTIWTIADAMAGEGEDPMAIVAEIRRLNGLPDSLIRTGTKLYVPASP